MTLPSTGAISMAMVAAELGISAAGLSLNDSRVRNLAGRPSGSISFSDLRGKSAYTPMTGSGSNAEGTFGRAGNNYTATLNPSVSIAGGAAPFTYSWSFINSNGASLGNATSNPAVVNYLVSRFGSPVIISVSLQCQVTDSTGRTLLISPVYASFDIV